MENQATQPATRLDSRPHRSIRRPTSIQIVRSSTPHGGGVGERIVVGSWGTPWGQRTATAVGSFVHVLSWLTCVHVFLELKFVLRILAQQVTNLLVVDLEIRRADEVPGAGVPSVASGRVDWAPGGGGGESGMWRRRRQRRWMWHGGISCISTYCCSAPARPTVSKI